MEGKDIEFVNFTLPTLKAFLEAHRMCLATNNKPQNAFFTTNSWSSGQPKNDADTSFPPSIPFPLVIFSTATVVAFVLLRNPRFNFHCYIQREAMPTQKSARKWRCDLSQLLAQKITKGIHTCKPASLHRPTQFVICFSAFCACKIWAEQKKVCFFPLLLLLPVVRFLTEPKLQSLQKNILEFKFFFFFFGPTIHLFKSVYLSIYL